MAANIWRHIGNSLANGIEKHTVGVMGMFSSIAFILVLLIKEGGSQTVESLITTLMIVSAALMGITSVAGSISSSNSRCCEEIKDSDSNQKNSSHRNSSSINMESDRYEEGC